MNTEKEAINTSKLSVWIIILFPIVGILTMTAMYYTGIGVPKGTTNNGTLIEPPRSITEVTVSDASGNEFIYNDHIHQWTVLIPAAGGCNAACEQTLYFTRQMHTALGKQAPGLRRFYITDEPTISDATQTLLDSKYDRVKQLFVNPADLEKLLDDLDGLEIEGADYRNGKTYFLIDPIGFVMMVYTDQHGLKPVLSDLKFLLKQSGESE